MPAVLIAYGANDLEIPCRMFDTLEQGKEACDDLFGAEGVKTARGGYLYEKYLDEGDDPDGTLSKELFTRYYYGCGGPGPFYLKHVEVNTKFVGFDLD